jgi:murein L,D-transpeptidase YcbB/YkuD
VLGFLTFILIVSAHISASLADVPEELKRQLNEVSAAVASDEQNESLAVLAAFYTARAMAPIWVDEEGATARGQELFELLAGSDADGLDPDDYGAQGIAPLLGATNPALLADLERRLSLGLVQLASDLGQGRVEPHIADPDLFPFREEIDKAKVIEVGAEAKDVAAFVSGFRPQTPRYDRLKEALAFYRKWAATGGWAPLVDGPTLKPGMTEPRVAALRERLRLWGDLDETEDAALDGGDPAFYDAALEAAVKRMQFRHGLESDGAVGRKTRAALNVPVELRIEQIVLNLERRRWMPDDLGQRYIFVNLADFILKLVDEPKTVFDTRVVVGKPYHMTPIFSESMTYVVINPYWHVPPSIAGKEILPKIKKDVGYLAEHNFTLFSDWNSGASIVDPNSVDWSQVSQLGFRYKLRQDAGDGNALGQMKFMFPNRFNIYLHDTPAKSLFKRADRGFSHGCIRVEDPESLAEVLFARTNTTGWTLERITDAIDEGERQIVTLSEPLPVHLSYLTSWVNKDGSVHFRKDVYDRDADLADILLGQRATRLARIRAQSQ